MFTTPMFVTVDCRKWAQTVYSKAHEKERCEPLVVSLTRIEAEKFIYHYHTDSPQEIELPAIPSALLDSLAKQILLSFIYDLVDIIYNV